MVGMGFPSREDRTADEAGGVGLPRVEVPQQIVIPADVASFKEFQVPSSLRHNCRRHYDLAVKSFAAFCMGADVPGQPFYSQGTIEDYSIEPLHNKSLDKIIGSHLTLLIEDYGIENPKFLQFVRAAGSWETQLADSTDLTHALAFLDPDKALKASGIEAWAALLNSFLKVADDIAGALQEHGAIFSDYGICNEPQVIGQYAGLLCDVLRNATFKSDGKKSEISLPDSCLKFFPLEHHVREYETLDPFVAKRKFLIDAGFEPHMEHLLALGLLMHYSAQAERCDSRIYQKPFGVHLDLHPSSDGFYLELKGFTHPRLGLNQPLGGSLIHSLVDDNTDLLRELVRHGMVWCPADDQKYLFGADREYTFSGDTDSRLVKKWADCLKRLDLNEYVSKCLPRWSPGLTPETLATWGDEYWRKLMLSDFQGDVPGSETAFDPSSSFCMGGDFKLQVVGADNMEGKTWVLRALPALIMRNQRGRRTPALNGSMTMCDGIYHNIEQESYAFRKPSGVQGDLIAVGNFLKFATANSAGFFDEIFGEASAPCELSFAWACFEEMERKNLVALCSSHNPFLNEFGWTKGLNGLQGHFAPDQGRERGEPRPGFRSLTMKNHNLVPGQVTVSEGFCWADEYLPSKVAERARVLFEYLTGVDPTR